VFSRPSSYDRTASRTDKDTRAEVSDRSDALIEDGYLYDEVYGSSKLSRKAAKASRKASRKARKAARKTSSK